MKPVKSNRGFPVPKTQKALDQIQNLLLTQRSGKKNETILGEVESHLRRYLNSENKVVSAKAEKLRGLVQTCYSATKWKSIGTPDELQIMMLTALNDLRTAATRTNRSI